MGHLLSRAFRRLTQGNQARNSLPEPASDQNNAGRTDRPQFVRTTIESIPVGESLDSADYTGIEVRSSRTKNDGISADDRPKEVQEKTIVVGGDNNNADSNIVADQSPTTRKSIEDMDVAKAIGQVPAEPAEAAAMVAKAAATITDENSRPQDVEEAVIKIQAYVRGHLTRKALKGAHHNQQQQQQPPQPLQQQQNSPNAIGQRQFDEDSLIRNPPSAVFSPSSPFNAVSSSSSEQQQKVSITRAPLESIAEVSEGSITTPAAASQQQQQQSASDRRSSLANSRKRLSPIPIAPNDDANAPCSPGSVSPALSEAGASIDLGFCATPSSVSIDIADHNIIPTDKLATVLHHRERDSIADRAAESASETLHEIHAPSSTVSAADAAAPVDAAAPETSATATTSEKQEPSASTSSSIGVPRLELNQPSASPQEVRNEPTIQMAATTTLHQNGQAKASSAGPLLDTEQAAAIRIQSAFRGYRSRKNSPYRSRSPNNRSGSSTLPHNNNDNHHANNNNNNNSVNHHDSIQVALDKN